MTFGFCTSDGGRPSVLSKHGVALLSDLARTRNKTPISNVRELIPDWDGWCDLIEEVDRSGQLAALSVPDDAIRLQAPILDPPAIYCAGANYYDHAHEMGTRLPDKSLLSTFHFLIAPTALSGHRSAVHRPVGCRKLDWEVELVVVVGRRASRIDAANAADHIVGYTIANDISARDYSRSAGGLGIDWLRHKSFVGLTPTGPAIIPSRYVPDAMHLDLQLTVNGRIKQHSNTEKMIFSVSEQVAELSMIAPLQPGDLILTGTPAGTAGTHGHYLEPGDTVVAEVEGLGRLENQIA